MKKWIVADPEHLGEHFNELTMTSGLEHLLDEGLENFEHSKTTDELRRRTGVLSPQPSEGFACSDNLIRAEIILDCGGKRSATPLSHARSTS